MNEIRARACTRCREYVTILPDSPVNQNLIKTFEGKHRGHTIITVDLDEVKGGYENFEKATSEESAEEASESSD